MAEIASVVPFSVRFYRKIPKSALASDGEKKAAHYFVADVRADRAFAGKGVKGHEASSKCFRPKGRRSNV